MAKLTLLSIVNSYMTLTDNHQVSSIDDTIEAQQVAEIAKQVFEDVSEVFNSKVTRTIIQLESLADNTKPNYLRLPDNVQNIESNQVMYNVAKSTGTSLKLTPMEFKTPTDFLIEVGQRSTNQNNTEIVTDHSGYKFVIQNKTAPSFFTSFDDEHLVFDAYNSDVDTVLQASKSGILTTKKRSFVMKDTYVIDLPEWFHTGYRNEVVSTASAALREEPLPKQEKAGKLAILRARKKQRVGSHIRKRRYGRS